MRLYGQQIIDISARRDRIVVWDAMGVRHFTENDIPQWVKEKSRYGWYLRVNDEMGEVYKYLIYVKHNRKCMFEVDGVVHFDLSGYKKIIDYVEWRELMRQEDIDRWRKEVFGKSQPKNIAKNKKGPSGDGQA